MENNVSRLALDNKIIKIRACDLVQTIRFSLGTEMLKMRETSKHKKISLNYLTNNDFAEILNGITLFMRNIKIIFNVFENFEDNFNIPHEQCYLTFHILIQSFGIF